MLIARFSSRSEQRWLMACFVGLCLGLMVILGLRQPDVAVAAPQPKHYDELEFPPLGEIEIPDYERYQLDTGLTVYLMEDHELPLVSGIALIPAAQRLEPEDKVGLGELTGTVLRSGGTEDHPVDELNQLLEQRAASVESRISTTFGRVNFQALAPDLEEVFSLYAEVIQQPTFAPDRIALAKEQKLGEIARRGDDPQRIAFLQFPQLLYGEDNPYARLVNAETLEAITRQDLIEFHQTYFQPEGMLLGIVGDIDPEQVKELIEQEFGDWQPEGTVTREVPEELAEITPAHTEGLFLIDQPQLTQSSVQIGHLGGLLNDPDYPALQVMEAALNGFGGRLFQEIRSRQGLAYSVYAVWAPAYDFPGTLVAGGQTRSETTAEFITSIQEELQRIQAEPLSDQELAYAKDSVLNSFVFNFQDPSQTLSRLLRYEFYGYPEDFVFQFRTGIEETDSEAVLAAAQEHLKLDQLVTLVVGNAEEIEESLEELGEEVIEPEVDFLLEE